MVVGFLFCFCLFLTWVCTYRLFLQIVTRNRSVKCVMLQVVELDFTCEVDVHYCLCFTNEAVMHYELCFTFKAVIHPLFLYVTSSDIHFFSLFSPPLGVIFKYFVLLPLFFK